MLVWDLRNDPSNSRIEFWLQSIVARAGSKVPVLLVGTHSDDKQFREDDDALVAKLESVAEEYSKRFPSIKLITAVSCADGAGMDELKESLIESALQQKHMGEPLPMSYLTLEEEINKIRDERASRFAPPIIEWNEFKSIGNKCHILSQEALKVAARFLHDLGALLYYPISDEGELDLSNIVIVDPKWLIYMMVCFPSFSSSLISFSSLIVLCLGGKKKKKSLR